MTRICCKSHNRSETSDLLHVYVAQRGPQVTLCSVIQTAITTHPARTAASRSTAAPAIRVT